MPKNDEKLSDNMTAGMVQVVTYDHHGPQPARNNAPNDDSALGQPAPSAASMESFCFREQGLACGSGVRLIVSQLRSEPMATKMRTMLEARKVTRERDDEEDEGQGVHDIDNAHHDLVNHPAEIAGYRPPGDANHQRDAGRRSPISR